MTGRTGDIVPDASTILKGIVELATNQEAIDGIDMTRAVTPAGVAAVVAAACPTWNTLEEKPAVVAAGATAEAARIAIGAGTSSFSGSYDDLADTPDIPDSADDIGAAPATQTINAQTGTTYTIASTDANGLVTLNNTAEIIVTVPADVIPAGQSVDVVVLNTGMATLVGSGGMVLQPEGGLSLTSRAQYSVFTILALSTTLAVVTGSLAAA